MSSDATLSNQSRLSGVRLAVNLYDLDRLSPHFKQAALTGCLDTGTLVRVGDNTEDVAVPFCCSLQRAAATCDVMRDYDRAGKNPPTRIYLSKDGGDTWKPVPGDTTLTHVWMEGSKTVCRLNSAVFPIPHRLTPPTRQLPRLYDDTDTNTDTEGSV